MKIGEVSDRLGMPASTIRYYEKIGVIDRQPRDSGRRVFGNETLLLLRFVQLAQAAGFSISEIKALLDNYGDDPSPAGMWKPFTEAKLEDVRNQIDDLRKTEMILSALSGCKCGTIVDCVQSALDEKVVKG